MSLSTAQVTALREAKKQTDAKSGVQQPKGPAVRPYRFLLDCGYLEVSKPSGLLVITELGRAKLDQVDEGKPIPRPGVQP